MNMDTYLHVCFKNELQVDISNVNWYLFPVTITYVYVENKSSSNSLNSSRI